MKKIMLTAMHSGAGKTVMTCALLAALKQRGIDVRSFKCGPDYIDPMFHSRVLGVPSRNVDLFLQGQKGIERTFTRGSGELAVLEGAMGYYDGLSGTDTASAWDAASRFRIPAVLILRPKGTGVSLAAQVKGMMDFREDSMIRGLLLADCSPSLAAYLTPILTRETALPVLGYLPPMEEAVLGSRHLGLLTAAEIQDLSERMRILAEQMEKTVRIDDLLALAEEGVSFRPEEFEANKAENPENPESAAGRDRVRIAVAFDEAFCFYYEDSLDALREAGAEIVAFSPLHARALPENIHGLYLGGGYPELYAAALADNGIMRTQIREAVRGGLPTVAECGGFLYLQDTLEDEKGNSRPMCGVFSGKGFRTERLQRFGYQYLESAEDSLLLCAGERVPVHEFHYWDCTENGSSLRAVKPDGRSWTCGCTSPSLYAAFPHLHLDGELPLAERFIQACCRHEADER